MTDDDHEPHPHIPGWTLRYRPVTLPDGDGWWCVIVDDIGQVVAIGGCQRTREAARASVLGGCDPSPRGGRVRA